jgi:hypothetical protein
VEQRLAGVVAAAAAERAQRVGLLATQGIQERRLAGLGHGRSSQIARSRGKRIPRAV